MSDSPAEVTPEAATDRASQLQHVAVERNGAEACTMFPRDADENALSTQWVTATADSFVSLEERR